MGRRPGPGVRRRAGRRVAREGRERGARAGREHRTARLQRPLRRVLRRGSAPRRPDRRGRGAGYPGPARDRHGQALRAEQPGDRPLGWRLDRLGARHAGDLPARVRDGDPGGRGGIGDVLLQPRERHLRLREPLPARRRPPQGLGVHRLRHVGLGGTPQHGAGRPGRDGHGHARNGLRAGHQGVLRREAQGRGGERRGPRTGARRHGPPNPVHDVQGRPLRPSRDRADRRRQHGGAQAAGAQAVRGGQRAAQEPGRRPPAGSEREGGGPRAGRAGLPFDRPRRIRPGPPERTRDHAARRHPAGGRRGERHVRPGVGGLDSPPCRPTPRPRATGRS
jgi:hypothetical protein